MGRGSFCRRCRWIMGGGARNWLRMGGRGRGCGGWNGLGSILFISAIMCVSGGRSVGSRRFCGGRIVRGLDVGRIVYHDASGNMGSMHVMNYYANFSPIQEQSDWFEHWAKVGVKPVFMCEYGVPFTWDWTMYRGWYKGQREFGSAK